MAQYQRSDLSWPLPSASPPRRTWNPLRRAKRRIGRNEEDVAKAKEFLRTYGVGMALGFLAVHFTKKLICKIPLVGSVARPILGLFPTLLVGPALGAAVTYGLVEGDGDLMAAREPVQRQLGSVGREVEGRVRDLHRGINERVPRLRSQAQHHHQQFEAEAQQLVGSLGKAVDSLERDVAPILEQREAKQQLELMKKDWPRRP